jgi:copper chaperone
MSQELTYTVEGMTCAHCTAAVTTELLAQAGVVDVDVDLDTKRVVATGTDLDDDALRAAIARAGYEVA